MNEQKSIIENQLRASIIHIMYTLYKYNISQIKPQIALIQNPQSDDIANPLHIYLPSALIYT